MVDAIVGRDESAAPLTADEIAQLFPRIADSLSGAAAEGKATPADMQATLWHRAMQP